MNYPIAIWKVNPAIEYNIVAPGYEGIQWKTTPIPESQLQQAWRDYLNTDLKTRYDLAIQSHYATLREEFLTPGKDTVYQAKRLEIEQYDRGERSTSQLPFMENRRLVLEQLTGTTKTLADARQNWQKAIDHGRVGLARLEYQEELYRSQLAVMVVDSEEQLHSWLDDRIGILNT